MAAEVDYLNEQSAAFQAHKRTFSEFFEENHDKYENRVRQMLGVEKTRLIVDLNDIRRFNAELGRDFLKRPLAFLAPFQAALKTWIGQLENVHVKLPSSTEFQIGLEGSFGANRLSPRQLMARHLSNLVCLEGIVTRCSTVRPKVQKSVHYCEATGKITEMAYHDATSLTGFPTGSMYPTKDGEGNPLSTEFGLSEYMDHQMVTLQEMPERAPAGLLPSSVDCIVDRDLVDLCKPGDRIQLIGMYRALPSKGNGQTSGIFRSVIIANNIRQVGKEQERQADITDDDIRNIKKLAKQGNVFDMLARSVAPSIFGHENIKKALILQLLGGVEHNLDNGTHIRGDINLLMVGDPSTAKSQLLRFILNIAPLAINTTGRGSSGVGLTAAVMHDKDTGERRLEAGAMVLGDRGIVCIDEFDKMSDVDRVAIHEVMEQQTVTIAKAGIHMSLNARCSVTAAANPQYGQYMPEFSPMVNVNLPDSLLSRFDLLFIVLDTVDPEIDRAISDHVLKNHRFLKRGLDALDGIVDEKDEEEEEETQVFQKFDRLLHGQGRRRQKVLTVPFLKKYVAYAKKYVQPKLSEAASALVASAYVELRTKESENAKTLPVTARSLETLIRLSSAHAKAHLRKEVTVHDVNTALELMKFALHNEVLTEDPESSSSEDDDEDGHDGDKPAEVEASQDPFDVQESPQRPRRSRPSTPRKRGDKPAQAPKQSDAMDIGSGDEEPVDYKSPKRGRKRKPSPKKSAARSSKPKSPARSSPRKKQKAPGEVTAPRRKDFQKRLVQHKTKTHTAEYKVERVLEVVNDKNPSPFTEAEVRSILKTLDDENKVFFKDDTVHMI